MATRVSVTVEGRLGLDDPDRMLRELEQATRLSWRREEADREPALGGLPEIVLEAVIGKGVEMSVEYAVEAVRRCIGRWRAERLDPPRMDVRTSSADEPGPDGTGG
ncbi:hypothetical protein [Streptomyces luteireticuli]|uniref:hypothetical protein n=1 Tax=Streptomyces luteireticuli TaxID=173858 RepID=UPI0031CF4D78